MDWLQSLFELDKIGQGSVMAAWSIWNSGKSIYDISVWLHILCIRNSMDLNIHTTAICIQNLYNGFCHMKVLEILNEYLVIFHQDNSGVNIKDALNSFHKFLSNEHTLQWIRLVQVAANKLGCKKIEVIFFQSLAYNSCLNEVWEMLKMYDVLCVLLDGVHVRSFISSLVTIIC